MALIDCLKKFPTDPSGKLSIVGPDRAEILAAAKAYEADGLSPQEAAARAVQNKVDELVAEYDRVNKETKAAWDSSEVGKRQKVKKVVEAKVEPAPEPKKEDIPPTTLEAVAFIRDALPAGKEAVADTNEFVAGLKGARTVGEALAAARKMELTEAAKALIDTLLNLDTAMAMRFSTNPEIAGSFFRSKDSHVELGKNASLHALLHESVHAGTVAAIKEHVNNVDSLSLSVDLEPKGKTPLGRNFVALYEAAQRAALTRGVDHYGMRNIYEFTAEAMTNPKFQEFLASVQVPVAGKPKTSLMERFVELVKKMLGVKQSDTLLDAVISATEDLFQQNEALFTKVKGPDIVLPSGPGNTLEGLRTVGSALRIDNLGRARRGILGFQFLRDIKDVYTKTIPAVKVYVDRVFAMASTANDILKEGSKIAKRWDTLDEVQSRDVSELMAQGTVMEAHGDIPLDLQDHTTAAGTTISNKHLAVDGKFSDDVVAAHAALQGQWAKLGANARQVYTSARDMMAKYWSRREKLLNKAVTSYFDPEIARARRLDNEVLAKKLEHDRDDYIKEYGRQLARVRGPYFPLLRFGDFFVVYKSQEYKDLEAKLVKSNDELADLYTKYNVPNAEKGAVDVVNAALAEQQLPPIKHLDKAAQTQIKIARKEAFDARKEMRALQADDKHYWVESFESEAAATARGKEEGLPVRLKEDYFKETNGATYSMIQKIGDAVEASIGDKKLAGQAREAMMQVWLQSLPDTSALRRQIRRKKVGGFSRDMLRSFSAYTQRDSHFLSRLEHMDDIIDALLRVRRETKASGLPNEEVYNELARRYAASMRFVDTPVEDAVSAMAFVFQLGVSPAFLLTNLTQPFMISMPVIASRHGLNSTQKELRKAFGEVFKAAKTSHKEQGTVFFEINTDGFSNGEQAMLKGALQQGLLDITLEYDLGAFARGGETKLGAATRLIAVAPHQVEVVNRMLTALAAYRLEMRKGGDQAKAEEYAMATLSRTHFDYSATNAPYYMKPGVVPFGKLIFQYRKYQLGTFTLLARSMKAAVGENTEARKEARRALTGLFVMHGAFAGALGLPFVGTATMVANLLQKVFGDDNEPWDTEAEMRNWLADILGVEAGAAAAKGLPMLLGVDLSNKIGMGSVAAPVRILRDYKEGRDLYLEVLASLAGPAIGGQLPRFVDGVAAMERGDLLKASELMTPKFVADVIKAARINEQGLTTKRGNVTVDKADIDAWDTLLTALGVPPKVLTESMDATARIEDVKQFLKSRRGELEKDYVIARVQGDTEKLASVQSEIRAFNEARQAKGEPTIKPVDLINAYKQRESFTKNKNAQGISLPKSQRALGEYGRFADTK